MKANEHTSLGSRFRITPTSSPDDEVRSFIRRRRLSLGREGSEQRIVTQTPPISPSVIVPPSDVFPPPMLSLTMELVHETSKTAMWEIIGGVACMVIFFVCTILENLTGQDPQEIGLLSLIKLITKPGVVGIMALHLAGETLWVPDNEVSIFSLLRIGPTLMGLVFSALGDFLLQVPSSRLLWLNLGGFAFLMTHVLYSVSFLLKDTTVRFNEFSIRNHGKRISALFAMIIYGFALLTFLVWGNSLSREAGSRLTDSPAFLSYLMVYLVTLLFMAWQATATRNWSLMAGALLFVLSDSVLFASLFVKSFPASQFVVLSTYWTGQLLITQGSTLP